MLVLHNQTIKMHIKQLSLFYIETAHTFIKHFHWLIGLFWPIRFDVTIVSI